MANNKVQLSDGTVLIDTSMVTVTPEALMNGYTALNKSGELIVGNAVSGGRTATITSDLATGDSDAYVEYHGVRYRGTGTSFSFVPGDILNVYPIGANGPDYIYVNGVFIYQWGSRGYSYILPDADVNIEITAGSNPNIYLTTVPTPTSTIVAPSTNTQIVKSAPQQLGGTVYYYNNTWYITPSSAGSADRTVRKYWHIKGTIRVVRNSITDEVTIDTVVDVSTGATSYKLPYTVVTGTNYTQYNYDDPRLYFSSGRPYLFQGYDFQNGPTAQWIDFVIECNTENDFTSYRYPTTYSVDAVTTTNLTPSNIKSGVAINVGDTSDDDGIASATGTFTAANTVSSGQTAAAAGQMLSGYSAWVDGAEVKGSIATKAASDLTASGKTVTVPAGYYAAQATKDVASGSATTPATTITANPTITVNTTTGEITATTSASKSVTPAVSAGYVSVGTAGTVTVNGSGTSQIDVYEGEIGEGSSDPGGDNELIGFIERTLTTFENSGVTQIGRMAFSDFTSLTNVSLPNLVSVGYNGFNSCTNLVQYNLPNVTTLDYGSFSNCQKLPHLVFPKVTSIPANCFVNCREASAGDFVATSIAANVFRGCSVMNILILRSQTLVPIGGSDTFINTPFYSGKAGGTIYIPKMLYDHLGDGSAQDYKAATNWTTYDGYGTITWAPIEGSIYETQYADGTPIT